MYAVPIEFAHGMMNGISTETAHLLSFQLFSGSFDRCIKHWNIDQMGYVETLYGHHSQINSLSALHGERCVSCGGDRTVRLWKVRKREMLLVHMSSAGCVVLVRSLTVMSDLSNPTLKVRLMLRNDRAFKNLSCDNSHTCSMIEGQVHCCIVPLRTHILRFISSDCRGVAARIQRPWRFN